jgi:protein TonB
MFEQSLVGIGAQGRDPRRLYFLPAVVLLHGAVFAGITVANAWEVGDVGEPRLIDVFLTAPAPPPEVRTPQPERPATAPVARPAVGPPSAPPPGPVQPETVHELAPPGPEQPTTPQLVFIDSALPIGPGGGGGDGPPGPAVLPGPPGDGGGVQRYTVAMTRPEAIFKPSPVYPETARKVRRVGTVVVEAIIDIDGSVRDVQLLKGLGYGCDEAAVSAVQRWRFRPAMLDGRAVPVYYRLSVRFVLQ